METRKILVLTTSRADFGIYKPVLAALADHPALEPMIIATGTHLEPAFGETIKEVEASGYPIAARFACIAEGDNPVDIGLSMARATSGMAKALNDNPADLLLVLGDRFEMLAAASAAPPFGLPIAHIHGGEETEGAIDNVFRHMLTKMSHLHFCATELSARRIRQMGELSSRVIVSGAPALDAIATTELLSRTDLAKQFGLPAEGPFLLATYHPVTLDLKATDQETEALFAAIEEDGRPTVFTAANADTAGRRLNERIKEFVKNRPTMRLVGHMGARGYFSAMAEADIMIGNSSSGILEAASFGLPVVNIGDRQKGRERSPNVIDCTGEAKAITSAITRADTPAFRKSTSKKHNIYGDGRAGAKIADAIAQSLRSKLSPQKPFQLLND